MNDLPQPLLLTILPSQVNSNVAIGLLRVGKAKKESPSVQIQHTQETGIPHGSNTSSEMKRLA